MKVKDSSRQAHFPAILKKHGKSMKYWLAIVKKLEAEKYPVQIAHLKNKYGFSQTHANALGMFAKGSKSSKRFANHSEYYKSIDPLQAKTIKRIFRSILRKYPKLEQVIAWNQPMLKHEGRYIFGVSTAKNHILIAPFDAKVFKQITPYFRDFKINKKTIALPNDWSVDTRALHKLIGLSITKKS